MPLNQFKTQVLLLHSEQSTLDSLSSGFGDRYTVHCATSGVQALTTLGETPINVIISAQKLPGMSGAEALREAKKRSPETIGILLASNADQGVEAIVGEKEVFQIVRGDVTGDALRKLVDNATQQVRLMALAESANDVAANMDEPAAHIIMETAENGSALISDATGRFPSLDPDTAAGPAVGSRSVDVLVMTKDEEFLSTIRESSRGMHNVLHANTLKQADEAVREHKVGVAVVDAAMVGEKVEQLTLHMRRGSPRLVSIVAGRRDDGEMLMGLINRGKVYRFLMKPVSPGRARLAVEASIKHHLEAPDAAFKISGAAAPVSRTKPVEKPAPTAKATPAPKPAVQQKPEPGPSPKPAPKPVASNAPKPAPQETPEPAAKTVPEPAANKASPTAATVPSLRADPPLGDPIDPSSLKDRFDGWLGSGTMGGSRIGNPMVLGIGAIASVAVAGMLFWLMGGEPDATEQNIAGPAAVATPSITEADLDFNAPAEEPVVDEVLVNEALAAIEAALLESRLDDATAALQRVAELDPDNARLPFLTAQVKQVQLRTYMAGARNAIRDTRFEDAANLLAEARALGLSDRAEIDAVAEELRSARSEQRVDEVLALAAARLEEGDLLAPVNDNARYYYELVLSNAPDNATARQGLSIIASKLVLQARAQIDVGNFDNAERLLGDARAIDASSSELAATSSALLAARDAAAERQRLAAEARRREEAERIAVEQRAEAERQAEAEAARQTATDDAVAEAAPATGNANEPTIAMGDSGAADAAPEQSAQVEAAEDAAATEPRVVSISSLTRTRYVAPNYPRAAERRGESGWVDIMFTVAVDGTVRDVEVRDSTPEGVFDRAATRAVEKWEFEPVTEDGLGVERRAGVRMMFALE